MHQWFEHKYSFLIQPMVFAFTFYLLHSVNHFTYTLMIWMYGPFLDGSTGINFYLLTLTLRNSLHISINDINTWTLLVQPLLLAFSFYFLHPVRHFTYASMIWTYKLFHSITVQAFTFCLWHPEDTSHTHQKY